ncbi:MAG: hypothetical protein HYX24_03340 [Candidatus Aenigmarchaeota archaeon]|nr:hypothetical protein [Candidatus Aenigmarchaeota archaeon]
MKLPPIFLFSVAALLIVSNPAAAFMAVSIGPKSQTVLEGQQAVYKLKVFGESDTEKKFRISVDGPHLEWRQPTQLLIEARPQREETADIIFVPNKAGNYTYSVVISDVFFPEDKAKVGFEMSVLPRPPELEAGRLELKEDGNLLHVSFDVRSRNRDVFPLMISIKDNDGIIVRQLFSDEPTATSSVSKTVSTEGLAAGIYNVEVGLDSIVMKDSFLVEPIHNIVTRAETVKGPSYDEVVITVSNNGNIAEKNYMLESSISRDLATGFVTKPLSCADAEKSKDCIFLLGDIRPGQERKVVYRLEYWPSTARFVTGVIVLSAIAIGLFLEYSRPKVRKKYVTKDKREHNIIVEVRNPVRRLKNVIVRDFVSPLASVTDFGNLKPVVKRSDAGTELIWRLGDLTPKDHRVISYTIRPIVLGSLKMPRAYIRYGDEKGTKKVYSSRILIE